MPHKAIERRREYAREYGRTWYLAHQTELAEEREANREKKRAYDRARYALIRDRRREYGRRRRQRLGAALVEQRRARREAHRAEENEVRRKRYHADPVKQRAYTHTRRARIAGAGGSYTSAEWAALVERYDERCAYCGARRAILQADHRLPIARGGSSNIENILPACRSCNSAKRDLAEAEFRARL